MQGNQDVSLGIKFIQRRLCSDCNHVTCNMCDVRILKAECCCCCCQVHPGLRCSNTQHIHLISATLKWFNSNRPHEFNTLTIPVTFRAPDSCQTFEVKRNISA